MIRKKAQQHATPNRTRKTAARVVRITEQEWAAVVRPRLGRKGLSLEESFDRAQWIAGKAS